MLQPIQHKRLTIWAPIFLLIGLGLIIQTHTYLHADNGYFLHAAQLFLSGKSYTTGFFDPNPPLIILFYIPVLFLKQVIPLNIVNTFYLYITLLCCLSIGMCYNLLKKLFTENSLVLLMLYTITIVLFLLPNVAFGQREHLLVILTLPYFLTAMLRMQQKSISNGLAILIGIMAGIGFCLKPYFLPPLLLVETGILLHHKKISSTFRIETICIASVAIAYLATVYYLFPDYLSVVVPFIKKYYHIAPIYKMLESFTAYFLIVIACSIALYKKCDYPIAMKVWTLATIGFCISFFLSGRLEYYHVVPLSSFIVILAVFCCYQIIINVFTQSASPSTITSYLLIWSMLAAIFLFVAPLDSVSTDMIDIMAIRFFYIGMTSVSLTLIYFSVRQLSDNETLRFLIPFAAMLALLFSATPFGQREQLATLCFLPYLFGVAQRLYHRPRTAFSSAICGILLGVSLACDTSFWLLIGVLECYALFRERNVSWQTVSEIIIATAVYFLFISGTLSHFSFLTHTHWRVIQLYYFLSENPLKAKTTSAFETTNIYLCVAILCLSALHLRQTRYQLVNRLFFITLFSLLILLFTKHGDTIPYSTLPALCISSLIAAWILGEIITNTFKSSSIKTQWVTLGQACICVLACLTLFSAEIVMLFNGIVSSMYDKQKGDAILSFFKDHPGSTFDYFATNDGIFENDIYSSAHFVGQFPMIWWLHNNTATQHTKNIKKTDEAFVINLRTKSINNNQPNFILVETPETTICRSKHKKPAVVVISKSNIFSNFSENYTCNKSRDRSILKPFMQYAQFRKAWHHYRFVKTLDQYDIYQRI